MYQNASSTEPGEGVTISSACSTTCRIEASGVKSVVTNSHASPSWHKSIGKAVCAIGVLAAPRATIATYVGTLANLDRPWCGGQRTLARDPTSHYRFFNAKKKLHLFIYKYRKVRPLLPQKQTKQRFPRRRRDGLTRDTRTRCNAFHARVSSSPRQRFLGAQHSTPRTG